MLATKKEENRAEIFWICHCVLKGEKKYPSCDLCNHVTVPVKPNLLLGMCQQQVVLFLDSGGSTTFDMTVFNVGTK